MGGLSNRDIHRSVLLDETVSMLGVVPGGVYMDGTLGLGGHTAEILRRSTPGGRVVAFEWDEEAIQKNLGMAERYPERLTIVRRNYAEIEQGLSEAGCNRVDGIMVDIGLSSLQLDRGGRGFSFRMDETLDMRMDQRKEITAEYLLANASEAELADIFFYYGEEKQARRIASEIVKVRILERVTTTKQLADLVARVIPRRFHPPRIHVATKVFQALRIAVNEELKNLSILLDKAADHLVPGGRFCVISFHSLEDRMVKRKFMADKRLKVVTRKPVVPAENEIMENPRSRSARLRVAECMA